MIIRTASADDIDTLLKYDRHISAEEMKNSVVLGRVYIAEERGGFAGWLRYNMFWDNTPFMNMLFLKEEYRGRGFAKRLVCHWEERMKGMNFKTVMTSTQSDEYAQHFYTRLGYAASGGFVTDSGEYELIFIKRI